MGESTSFMKYRLAQRGRAVKQCSAHQPVLTFTVRLNNEGDFALPPSRVEAMYAPEMFGEMPNARAKVEAAK